MTRRSLYSRSGAAAQPAPAVHRICHIKRPVKAATACTMTLFAVSTVFMTQPIFPEIADTFGVSMLHARLCFSVASFFYAVAFFIIGPITDRFGFSKMAVAGMVFLSGAILFASCSTGFPAFVVAMGAAGFLAALVPASMFPYMSHLAPNGRNGVYVGAVVASATTGVIVGRALTGGLTGAVGWQFAFRLVALMLFMGAIISVWILDDQKPAGAKDRTVFAYYGDALSIVRDKYVRLLYAAGFLIFFGFIGMVTFLTYRLGAPPFNYPPEKIGWISFAGITALIAPFAGEVSKKTGIFQVLLPGILICIAAILLTGWFTSVAAVVSGLLLLFLGVYSCQPLLFLLVAGRIPASKSGCASSFYILSCIGGGSASTIVLGPVWGWYAWEGITLACILSLCAAFAVILKAAALR